MIKISKVVKEDRFVKLTHSTPEYFEELALKKKAKYPPLNRYISKTRTNLESKLKFSES